MPKKSLSLLFALLIALTACGDKKETITQATEQAKTEATTTIKEKIPQEQFNLIPGLGVQYTIENATAINIYLDYELTKIQNIPNIKITEKIKTDKISIYSINAPKFGKLEITFFEEPTIQSIKVYDTRYKTDKGIGPGSTRNEMIAAYGEPMKWDQSVNQEWTTAIYNGISFVFNAKTEPHKINHAIVKK